MSVENAWRLLGYVNGWLRFADAKAAAILSANSLLGALISALYSIRPGLGHRAWRVTLLSLALAAVATSGTYALRALRPHTQARSADSIVHFGYVAQRYGAASDAFVRSCMALVSEEERLIRDLCRQIWVNSILASQKYERVSRALTALVIGLALTLAASAALV